MTSLAEQLFSAYNEQGPNPWKTFDGRDVPKWADLNDQVRAKWQAAASTFDVAVHRAAAFNHETLVMERDMARAAYENLRASHAAMTAARDQNQSVIMSLRERTWALAHQHDVTNFMRAMEQSTPEKPTLDGYPFELRAKLILEEAQEFVRACGLSIGLGSGPKGHEASVAGTTPRHDEDWPEMIDALVDLLYVVYGAAVAMGVNLVPFWKIVHAANMAKAGGPVRADGKREKPPGWQAPDIAGLLAKVRGL